VGIATKLNETCKEPLKQRRYIRNSKQSKEGMYEQTGFWKKGCKGFWKKERASSFFCNVFAPAGILVAQAYM